MHANSRLSRKAASRGFSKSAADPLYHILSTHPLSGTAGDNGCATPDDRTASRPERSAMPSRPVWLLHLWLLRPPLGREPRRVGSVRPLATGAGGHGGAAVPTKAIALYRAACNSTRRLPAITSAWRRPTSPSATTRWPLAGPDALPASPAGPPHRPRPLRGFAAAPRPACRGQASSNASSPTSPTTGSNSGSTSSTATADSWRWQRRRTTSYAEHLHRGIGLLSACGSAYPSDGAGGRADRRGLAVQSGGRADRSA